MTGNADDGAHVLKLRGRVYKLADKMDVKMVIKDEKAKTRYKSPEDEMETYGAGLQLEGSCHFSNFPLLSLRI